MDHTYCDDPACQYCTEARFVKELCDRNAMTFRKLYVSYSGSLMGIISRVIPAVEIAEDILQETFIKIWKSIESYDASKGKLFTWMASLARNTAIDYRRGKTFAKSAKNENIEHVFLQVDSAYPVRYNTDAIGVKELVGILSAPQQQVLDLIYFHGYTQAEVAEELQIPLGTVKSRIRLAVKELRTYFQYEKPEGVRSDGH